MSRSSPFIYIPLPSVSPCLTAYSAAWVRSCTCSFVKIFEIWVFTVFSVTKSEDAISRLLLPLVSSASTSCSRGVSGFNKWGHSVTLGDPFQALSLLQDAKCFRHALYDEWIRPIHLARYLLADSPPLLPPLLGPHDLDQKS